MDKNAEHIVKVIDATAREAGLDNEQKAVNHSLRALKGMGAIPDRVAEAPWYAVAIDSSRHWNTGQGAMPVAVRAQVWQKMPPPARDVLDTSVNREVVLCGDGIGYWRVPLVNGVGDIDVPVNQYAPSGEGQLFVLDAEEPQRQGSTPSFTWS
jgi:hypothetical protein